jgi:DNA-binding XRE family transcriptional regulator
LVRVLGQYLDFPYKLLNNLRSFLGCRNIGLFDKISKIKRCKIQTQYKPGYESECNVNKIDTTPSGNVLVEMTPKEWHRASILFRSAEDLPMNVGEELTKYRRHAGISLDEAAKKLGISTNYATLIEWGLARNVSPHLRQRVLDLAKEGINSP